MLPVWPDGHSQAWASEGMNVLMNTLMNVFKNVSMNVLMNVLMNAGRGSEVEQAPHGGGHPWPPH